MSATDTDTARIFHPGARFWLWGAYVVPGWMQITSIFGLLLLLQAVIAVGLLFNSILDRRLVLGVFIVGWVGLVPYAYETLASQHESADELGRALERATASTTPSPACSTR